MSHYVDTMAYVGEIPWHTLGTYAGEENVTAKRMRELAEVTWDVEKVQLHDPDGRPVKGVFGLRRNDRAECFADVKVGSRYVPFQNGELFDFAATLRRESGEEVRFHTAGSLMEGRRVWLLAQLSGELSVTRRGGARDVSAPFFLISNSHDGSSSIIIANTVVRVVCWNTFSAALEGNESLIRIPHRANMHAQVGEAARVLGLASDYFQEYTETVQELADTPMDLGEFRSFARQIITGKDDPEEAEDTVARATGRQQTIMDSKLALLEVNYKGGRGNHGMDRADALNAVTEWIDHQRGRLGTYKDKSRRLGLALNSAAFGQGAALKNRALALLRK